jgi:N-acyl-D-amino-acid deacylase
VTHKEFDLVIRGGQIFDGTGREGFHGDIAVDGSRIVAVGSVEMRGREEIDASGKLVTPGFVDIHTHYDGQAVWSERLDPSSSHGVTTVVAGNCGVGFAPCRPEHRELLIHVMEGVEDIPEAVMAEGVPWTWQSFPEYLEVLERRPRDIDMAVYLPHSALRVFVMGERAARCEAATADDLEHMEELAVEALNAGAFGFSTSSIPAHRTSAGEPIPSYHVAEEELQAMARAISKAGHGLFQIVADFERLDDHGAKELVAMFARLSRTAGQPVTFTLHQSSTHPTRWRKMLGWVKEANRSEDVSIRPQVFPRPVGILMSHGSSLNPFRLCPTYDREIAHLPHAQKLERLRDPAVREQLLRESPEPAKQLFYGLARSYDRTFRIGADIDYEPDMASSLGAEAERLGTDPLEIAYDALLEFEGTGMLYMALGNYANGNLDHSLELMRDESTVLGLGDGGAHYGLICDGSYTTFLLSYWARDRARGRLELPEAVRELSHIPATLAGFSDRGLLRVGYKADINVIDFDALSVLRPHIDHDLPGNRARLNQKARGYCATIVSGQPIARDDEPTGKLPGSIIRAGV